MTDEKKAALDLAVLNLKTHGDDQLLSAVQPLIEFYESRVLAESKQEPVAKFDDPRVQTVYELICDGQEPPKSEHWDGYVSRRIVDALFTHPTPDDAKDAARYRWLRNEHFPTTDNPPLAQVAWKLGGNRHGSEWANLIDGNDLDAAIDAAMQADKEAK